MLLLLCLALAAPLAHALPTFDEVRAATRPSDLQLLSREGEVLQRVRIDSAVRRGQWLGLGDVSPALRNALVLSEDRRFYEHSGVDWAAVSAAAWANLWNQRTRGASTITMQLAGLLDEDWRQSAGGRSVAQKLGQAVAAQVLDRRWRKDQILEAYLNLVPFRGEVVGLDALSRTLFAKAAHGLDEREAAVAAALVRAPNARPDVVARRACGVLRDMAAQRAAARKEKRAAAVDCDALELFVAGALQRRAWTPSEGIAPHFARQWLRAAGGGAQAAAAPERLPLSAPLQRVAVQSLSRHLRELAGRNVQDGALVVLDNASGEVLAWVGSSGSLSQAGEVDGVLALRQPGSTLKPFLYAQALAERRLTAASLIEDSSAHIPTASGLYIPQNYDRQFKGLVSARTALAASLNVPAVRTLVMVTPEAFFTQLRALGLALPESGGYYGYSLALGSSEVQLLHLANAYRALANGGRYSPPRLRAGGAPPPAAAQALDAGAAFIVGDILSDANARVRTFGPDSLLATRFWTAVKTGTSKDMRDNWAVGWSQRYTVGVWVGNASGAAMHDVSGSSGAAPIWAEVMQWLHQSTPSRAPAPPAGVVRQAVRFEAGAGDWIESPRQEWFIAGTQQAVFATDTIAASAGVAGARGQKDLKPGDGAAAAPARIVAPAPGTIVALDPDIPPANQRLHFAAGDGLPGQALAWHIDGKAAGRGREWDWLPWPGRHRVQLLDARGQVLDEIHIEVRGAGVRAAARR
ncbi:penicillin-binding protein 1C [Pulveribacter suum]|uniref:peptidoglycan glycosyltransferase n=1 Tax=Pulveribacter suum TaxID=2116657 RepID=A0A2P1NPZ0_9BURK|nr:penicillin-binding protein 1C [Pulveribacter suum]